jgi:hypothetical protein
VQSRRNGIMAMIGVDIALEPLHAICRKVLGQL